MVLALWPGVLFAQESDITSPKSGKKFRILPVPVFGSSPETSFYFGAVGLMTFDMYQDSISKLSAANLEFNYTLKKQIIITADWFYYTRENKFIVVGNNGILKFPELFWGIGNNTPDSAEEQYQTWRMEFDDAVYWNLTGDMYAGVRFRLQHMFDLQPEAGGLLETGGITGSGGGTAAGIGLAFLVDRRDNQLFPSGGSRYLSLSTTSFNKLVGSQYNFANIEMDARAYFKGWKDHVAAIQFYSNLNFGDPPFRMTGLLGGPQHGRGYYRGRYRDNHYFFLQGEYRFTIWRWIGGTAFAGFGDVTNDFTDLQLGNLKYSLGGAIRIRVDKENRGWLRADFAVGKGSNTGFYLGYGESF